MRKKVLLTGGDGFIGKNTLELLSKKYDFFAPTHRELDLLDSKIVREFFDHHDIDVVIHCANIGGNRSRSYVQDAVEKNLKMFFNLVNNKMKFKKLIHLGSGAEYDKSRPIVAITENAFGETIPKDQYGFSKFICSEYAKHCSQIMVLRLFGVFGKHEDISTRFISQSIYKVLSGLPIIINQNVYFEYTYINDVISVIDHLVTHDSSQTIFNVGTGKKIDLLTIAKKINAISDTHIPIVIKKKGLQNEYTCDNSRLMQELPNFRFTPFDEALEELYLWYKKGHAFTLRRA